MNCRFPGAATFAQIEGRAGRGQLLVGPEHDDPQLAREQGFVGDGRSSDVRKRMPVEEFVDAVEEITILYRRGVPPL